MGLLDHLNNPQNNFNADEFISNLEKDPALQKTQGDTIVIEHDAKSKLDLLVDKLKKGELQSGLNTTGCQRLREVCTKLHSQAKPTQESTFSKIFSRTTADKQFAAATKAIDTQSLPRFRELISKDRHQTEELVEIAALIPAQLKNLSNKELQVLWRQGTLETFVTVMREYPEAQRELCKCAVKGGQLYRILYIVAQDEKLVRELFKDSLVEANKEPGFLKKRQGNKLVIPLDLNRAPFLDRDRTTLLKYMGEEVCEFCVGSKASGGSIDPVRQEAERAIVASIQSHPGATALTIPRPAHSRAERQALTNEQSQIIAKITRMDKKREAVVKKAIELGLLPETYSEHIQLKDLTIAANGVNSVNSPHATAGITASIFNYVNIILADENRFEASLVLNVYKDFKESLRIIDAKFAPPTTMGSTQDAITRASIQKAKFILSHRSSIDTIEKAAPIMRELQAVTDLLKLEEHYEALKSQLPPEAKRFIPGFFDQAKKGKNIQGNVDQIARSLNYAIIQNPNLGTPDFRDLVARIKRNTKE